MFEVKFFHFLLVFFSLLFSSCQPAPLGSKENPIKIYFTPSVDSGVIKKNSDVFIKFLEKETGHYFKTGIPTSYIAVVEAIGSKRADICVMNSFGYLLANKRFGAQAKLKVIRFGKEYYRGQILAHVDSKIKTINDIEGKKFAFTDTSSTSGFMFPLKILLDNKITPKNTIFAMKHDNVVTMIYQKQVDAGATFYSTPSEEGEIRDARALVKTQFPDVEKKIKIIEITEKIPNDPFVFRKNFPLALEKKFIKALKKFLSTEKGKQAFKNIYSVTGVVEADDSDYDNLREIIKATDIDINQFIN
jgi:phosphonate transport system substrate-binding protein